MSNDIQLEILPDRLYLHLEAVRRGNLVVILGHPDQLRSVTSDEEVYGHNCDQMGCGTHHVLFRIWLDDMVVDSRTRELATENAGLRRVSERLFQALGDVTCILSGAIPEQGEQYNREKIEKARAAISDYNTFLSDPHPLTAAIQALVEAARLETSTENDLDNAESEDGHCMMKRALRITRKTRREAVELLETLINRGRPK